MKKFIIIVFTMIVTVITAILKIFLCWSIRRTIRRAFSSFLNKKENIVHVNLFMLSVTQYKNAFIV